MFTTRCAVLALSASLPHDAAQLVAVVPAGMARQYQLMLRGWLAHAARGFYWRSAACSGDV